MTGRHRDVIDRIGDRLNVLERDVAAIRDHMTAEAARNVARDLAISGVRRDVDRILALLDHIEATLAGRVQS